MLKVEEWKRMAGAWQGAEPTLAEVTGWIQLIGGGSVELWTSGRRWAVMRAGEVLLFGKVPDGGHMRFAGLLAIGAGLGDEDVIRRDA